MGAKEFRKMTTHPPSLSDRSSRPIRVLVVDDNPQVLRDLRQLLELSGRVQVIGEAGDGLEAVRLAVEIRPEVVLMDLEMPGLDGVEATRQIKSRQPAPRVVILSVHTGPAQEERARAAGADSFVAKGTDYRILVNAILGNDGPINSTKKGEKS